MTSRKRRMASTGLALLVLVLAGGCESVGGWDSILTGTVTYRERMALPPGSVVEVTLEDVSRRDVAARVLVRERIEPRHAVPIPFELRYDSYAIEEGGRYAVRATIRSGDNLLFTTDKVQPVLTRGAGSHVDLVLVRASGGTAGGEGAAPVDDALVGKRWRLVSLGGETVEAGRNPASLELSQEDGALRASGSGGCNRFHGGCEIDGRKLAFGALAMTMMACPDAAMAIESRFLGVLGAEPHYEVQGEKLHLRTASGEELAVLEAWPRQP